jgi:transforming growth factor-beta-induced protein
MKTILSLLICLTLFVSLGCECCKPKPKCEPKKDSGTDCWHGRNILSVAYSDASLKTFVHLLKASDLNRTLRSPGPYTVFAPTDEAFKQLPAGQIDSWLQPENKDQLRTILLYHITPGTVRSGQFRNEKSVDTLNGKRLSLREGTEGLMVGKAKVVQPDIKAVNGVIHKIDKVLMPSSRMSSSGTMSPSSSK